MQKDTFTKDVFRSQELTETLIRYLRKSEEPGRDVGIYLAEKNLRDREMKSPYSQKKFDNAEKEWQKTPAFTFYKSAFESVWNDVQYFPVMYSSVEDSLTVNYENSWMTARTFGGKRGHEGTDLMASRNERGLYPVISMTDGIVTNKGWLPQGGWRIGITSERGAYFYYAHLDSYADITVGEKIEAGKILGYMGDSGYGKEGTVGKFPVHLHIGIYFRKQNKEISVNPYWVLKYIENSKLKCAYS